MEVRRMARYGWRPDFPDHRDRRYRAQRRNARELPERVDWSQSLPPCYDQGNLGSCTANALAGAIQFLELAPVMPSRLFIYYNERELEGSTDQDAGAMIRDGIKTLVTEGACPEQLWPYVPVCYAQKPSRPCYEAAEGLSVLQYERVDNTVLEDLLEALTLGPVVGGFTVYASFESRAASSRGIVPMPGPDEEPVGGHAILVTGYDQAAGRFLVRNSWGTSWGIKGYFQIPFQYFTNPDLADDFWLLTRLT